MSTKYVFVTGGVASSLGKGIIASSLAKLLQARGYKVAKGKSKEMGVVMRYEAGRKNRRVGKKLTLCEQRGELFSWGEALSAER